MPDEATAPETPATGTLQAQLRASIAQAQQRRTKDFEIPGYDPPLWLTLRAGDEYGEMRSIAEPHANVLPEAERDMRIAADTLIAMCLDAFAMVDGEKRSLGVTLGLGLAAYIGLEAENDRQAAFLIFGQGQATRTMPLMTMFAEYQAWSQSNLPASVREAAGNSAALSQ
jgi:hypothetical protein